MQRAQLWTPANAITASRIVAGPLCMWLLTADDQMMTWIALAVAVGAEGSDMIDGYVARSSAKVSNFGKILDPMADCLYRGSVFIAFVINGWMAIWMLSIIVWRDLAVSYLREIAELRAQTLGARISGKLKAIVQGIAQISVIAMAAVFGKADFAAYQPWVEGLLLVATAVTAYSLADYAGGVLQQKARAT